jgi:Spy/CpxP family protein refolding chaperone
MSKMSNALLIATVTMGLVGAAVAQNAPPAPPAWPSAHGAMAPHPAMDEEGMQHGRGKDRGHGFEGMEILHHLDLTAEQRDQIRTIHEASATDARHLREKIDADRSALLKVAPTDPAYAAAVAAAKEHAAAMVEHHAAIWGKVYAVLTPAQRARVPELVKKFEEHRERDMGRPDGHEGHRPGNGGPPPMPMPPPPAGPR